MDGRISNFMQAASIRRYEMTEGKERGLRVLDCDNGKLRFLLNESKALDVMQLYHKGQNISFISKNGFTAREIPFANRFEGGMLAGELAMERERVPGAVGGREHGLERDGRHAQPAQGLKKLGRLQGGEVGHHQHGILKIAGGQALPWAVPCRTGLRAFPHTPREIRAARES